MSNIDRDISDHWEAFDSLPAAHKRYFEVTDEPLLYAASIARTETSTDYDDGMYLVVWSLYTTEEKTA